MQQNLEQAKSQGQQLAQRHLPLLSAQEAELVQLLLQQGQAHIFAQWSEAGQHEQEKKAMLKEIADFQASYPGGVQAYVERARSLLEQSRAGRNPYAGFSVSEPRDAVRFSSPEDFRRWEPRGLQELGRTAFVVVAGGLGERLGFPGIKLALPSETLTGRPYLQLYCEHILAIQRAAETQQNKPVMLPLGIMTSDDTHELTVKLLHDHSFFGLRSEQVFIFKQDKVPALLDNDANFATEGPFSLDMKPHGHGDVHMLLHSQGLAEKWFKEWNSKWIVFFQDTNGLVFRALPGALGVSAELGLQMNSIAVPRKVGDAVGAICRLSRHQSHDNNDSKGTGGAFELPEELTINVEYNQMQALMQGAPEPLTQNGDSVFPGNINALVFEAASYVATLQRCAGMIVEFVNPKYTPDSNKTVFVKPTRLECMMQDYPKLLPQGAPVGFCQFERWTSFSALKNSVAAAVKSQSAGNAPECAASAEADQLAWSRLLLASAVPQHVRFVSRLPAAEMNESSQLAEAEAEEHKERTREEQKEPEKLPQVSRGGVLVPAGAQILLSPCVGVTQDQITQRFLGESLITDSSTLVLHGDVTLENLRLDGVLAVVAKNGAKVHVKDLTVRDTRKWLFRDLSAEDPRMNTPEIAIRGYVLEEEAETEDQNTGQAPLLLVFDKPGEYLVSDSTLAQSPVIHHGLQGLRELFSDCL